MRRFRKLLRFEFIYHFLFRGLDGVVKEERFTRIEQLGFGRFSFHGQNPEIEVSSFRTICNFLSFRKSAVLVQESENSRVTLARRKKRNVSNRNLLFVRVFAFVLSFCARA
jgi:hypothetical protein